MRNLYFYINNKICEYLVYLIIFTLFSLGVLFMTEMKTVHIGSILIISSVIFFGFNEYIITYLINLYRPEHIGANRIIRNFNLSLLSDDIKLDTYYRFLYRDLKRIFKPSKVKHLNNGRVKVICRSAEITYDIINDKIEYRYNDIKEMVMWDELMRKYNLEIYEDDEILTKWYINKFMI